MSRIPISQALITTPVNYRKEYARLYLMFYKHKISVDGESVGTIRDFCAYYFMSIPFRGTCLSLDDFCETYGFLFEQTPSNFDIDYLVSFCEYSFNILIASQKRSEIAFVTEIDQAIDQYLQQIKNVIDKIGYMPNSQNGITEFVPKDQVAFTVAETVNPDLSFRVIEYNHHSMKGNLNRKRDILLALANRLEPQRKRLKSINSTFETDLFYLFNSADIRHNNTDPDSEKYNQAIAEMDDEAREKWYDDTYQMCLLAFLELEHVERKKRIAQLKQANQK